jgi:hypothetical protein
MPPRFRGSIKGTMSLRTLALALLVALVAGCAGGSPTVNLSTSWPDPAASYEEAHARWTRKNVIHQGLDHVMTVAATALSADFRAAYVAERARRLSLSTAEREGMIAAEKTADGETVEFEVLLATNRADWNDLAKYPRSMWRVALVGDDGRVVLPTKIVPDKRVRAEVAEWFPDLGPFYKPYVVTFPRVAADGKPILGDGSKRMVLEMASAVGKTQLVWSAE